jgi:hypothetical protein
MYTPEDTAQENPVFNGFFHVDADDTVIGFFTFENPNENILNGSGCLFRPEWLCFNRFGGRCEITKFPHFGQDSYTLYGEDKISTNFGYAVTGEGEVPSPYKKFPLVFCISPFTGEAATARTVVTTLPSSSPPAVLAIALLSPSANSFTVQWSWSPSKPTGVSSYVYTYGTEYSLPAGSQTLTTGASASSTAITGLTPNTTYYIRVAAYNAVGGIIATSSIESVTTQEDLVTPPPPPPPAVLDITPTIIAVQQQRAAVVVATQNFYRMKMLRLKSRR